MTVSNGVVFNIPQQWKIHSYNAKTYIRITINYEYSKYFLKVDFIFFNKRGAIRNHRFKHLKLIRRLDFTKNTYNKRQIPKTQNRSLTHKNCHQYTLFFRTLNTVFIYILTNILILSNKGVI